MKKTNKTLAFLLVCVLSITVLSACGEKQSFERFLHNLFISEVTGNTINLHYTLEDPEGYGIKYYPITLGGYDPDGSKDFAAGLKKLQFELTSFPYQELSLEEQLTYDILNDYLNTQIDLSEFTLYEEPLSYSNGMQIQLPILLAEYEFQDEKDVKDYLKLIKLVDEYLEDMVGFEKEKSAAGLFMSESLCQRVIDSCEAFLKNQIFLNSVTR